MAKLTRKDLLQKTSAGALAVGALGAVPAAAVAATQPKTLAPEPLDAALAAAEPFVVYVSEPTGGAMRLMVGEREVAVHDPALVARLWRAWHTAAQHGTPTTPAQSVGR